MQHNGGTHRILRGLLCVETKLGELPVRVAVTHLDHMVEAERCKQMAHLTRELLPQKPAPEIARHLLLLGDLNALTREDYTEAQVCSMYPSFSCKLGFGYGRS